MKKIAIYIAMLFALVTSSTSQQANAQVGVSVSFQSFYDDLSPYGTWISYPEYGYVWHPGAGSGFHPYRTNGHWAWSDDYGWIWVSNYEWGWAPFHYGRWMYDSYYGWLWVPDYEWAPAWVVWRGGGDYYGWAPLGPGISISIAFGNYSPAYNYWSFVPRQYIASPTIYNYYVGTNRNRTIIRNTTVINNYSTSGGPSRNVFVTGPQRSEAEKYTKQKINPVRLSETTRPGRTSRSGNELRIYKPRVNASDKKSAKPAEITTRKTNENKAEQPSATQPQRNQPTRTEPQRTQPQRSLPTRTEQPRTPSQKNQPIRIEPKRTQPQRSQPTRTEQPRIQPQKTQPVRIEPQRNQPNRPEPQRNQPQRNEPPKKKGKG